MKKKYKNSFLAEHVPLLLHTPTAIPATSAATTTTMIPNNNNYNSQFITPSPTHYKSSKSSSSPTDAPTKVVTSQAINGNGNNLSPLHSMRGRLTIAQIKQNKTSDFQSNLITVMETKGSGKKKKKTSQL